MSLESMPLFLSIMLVSFELVYTIYGLWNQHFKRSTRTANPKIKRRTREPQDESSYPRTPIWIIVPANLKMDHRTREP